MQHQAGTLAVLGLTTETCWDKRYWMAGAAELTVQGRTLKFFVGIS